MAWAAAVIVLSKTWCNQSEIMPWVGVTTRMPESRCILIWQDYVVEMRDSVGLPDDREHAQFEELV